MSSKLGTGSSRALQLGMGSLRFLNVVALVQSSMCHLKGHILDCTMWIEPLLMVAPRYDSRVYSRPFLDYNTLCRPIQSYRICRTRPEISREAGPFAFGFVIQARDSYCTDDRETFSAPFGVAECRLQKPDYSKPLVDVYTNLIKRWIQRDGNLDL